MRINLHLQRVEICFSALLLFVNELVGILVDFFYQAIVRFSQNVSLVAAAFL
ncbi:hypothetical protein D3C76_989100 [compost metagenome]